MRALYIFILALLLFNCKDEKVTPLTCDVADPVNDLPWLKAKVMEIQSLPQSKNYAIGTTEFEGQTVFIVTFCCPTCSFFVPNPAFNCQGEQVALNLSPKRFIWKPADYECVIL